MTTRIGTCLVVLLGLTIGIAPAAVASADDRTTDQANYYVKAGSRVTVPIHVSDARGTPSGGSLQAGYGGGSLRAGTPESPPYITGTSPHWGPPSGGQSVGIGGGGFLTGCSFNFGGTAATIMSMSSTTAIVHAPPHDYGTVDVTVTNPDLSTATLVGGYRYADGPPPSIDFVSRAWGSCAGGELVTIYGHQFRPGARFDFGNATATIANFSSTQVADVYTPSHASGVVDVTVTNTDTTQGTLEARYTYSDVDLTGGWKNGKFVPRNKGSAKCGSFWITIFASSDIYLDSSGDPAVKMVRMGKGLGGGAHGQPIGLNKAPAKQYKYLIAVVDQLNSILEYDENNNIVVVKIRR